MPALPDRFSPDVRRSLRAALLAWYDRNRRSLPWREGCDPYRVLVSEFMLQQTQVATVLPYYERFLARFPTLEALARASDESVRAAWSGLGYYRRAGNLKAAAAEILEAHGGRLPADVAGLETLPGVGPYTARALASIVHDLPAAVVDGNVLRVLTRLSGFGEPVERARSRRAVQALADELVPRRRPGDWNQAMMELGATVCTPRDPSCPSCPWRNRCVAAREGRPERYPRKGPPRRPQPVERAVGILRNRRRVLLVRRRDPRLLDGTWELPGIDIAAGADPRAELARHLETLLATPVRLTEEIARIKHSLTHRRITLRGYGVEAPPPRASNSVRWVRADAARDLPLSSMTTKVLRAVEDRDPLPPASRGKR